MGESFTVYTPYLSLHTLECSKIAHSAIIENRRTHRNSELIFINSNVVYLLSLWYPELLCVQRGDQLTTP